MFWQRNTQDYRDRLDALSRALLREAGMTDTEIDRVASGISYSSVRVRIERESRRGPARLEAVLLTNPAAFHAAAAAAFVAVIAAGLFWLFEPAAGTSSLDSLLTGAGGAPAPSPESGRACALSTYKGCSLSREEVLETIVAKNAKE